MYRTAAGLRLRVVGENPEMADSLGIDVYKIQYLSVIFSGVLAGIGGAYLSIGDIHYFGYNMVAGRGYFALVANIFGGWNPLGSYLGALIFSFFESIQIKIQGLGFPSSIVRMLPYLITIFVIVVAKGNKNGPKAAGKHFVRSRDISV